MVKIGLQIRAQLENVTNVIASGEDFRWYLKLKCANCGDVTPEYVYMSLLDSQPLKGGRGSASLVLKCKLCSRENSINIIPESIKPYNDADTNTFKTIVTFDCRGTEPVSFSPRIGFSCDAVNSRAHFDDVNLSEDWADYDDKENQSVGIYELEHKFITVHK